MEPEHKYVTLMNLDREGFIHLRAVSLAELRKSYRFAGGNWYFLPERWERYMEEGWKAETARTEDVWAVVATDATPLRIIEGPTEDAQFTNCWTKP